MGMSFGRSRNKAPELTDMQQRYEAETGSTMFSKPPKRTGGRMSFRAGKDKKAFEEWSKTTTGMDAGKNRFNEMMANRSQNPALGQTQSGMSGFDKFQAMQAGRDVPTLGQPSSVTLSGMPGMLQAIGDMKRAEQRDAAQGAKSSQAGYDKFQAMQAARDDIKSNPKGKALPGGFYSDVARLALGGMEPRVDNSQAGYDRFQAQMGANPLILQQLQQQQMGQRQMGPQFNAFGFGAQPGLAAQGGQGGGMLANMSSQGMNQLAAGQQNNPTIFKAKS